MDGELCGGRRMARLPLPKEKKHKKRMVYKGLSRLVTGLGLAAVGLLAIPAGILFLLISGIWSATDWIAARLDQRGDEGHAGKH